MDEADLERIHRRMDRLEAKLDGLIGIGLAIIGGLVAVVVQRL